jgi:alpha-tubulin suppressor-like RCC1 family protein
MSETGSFRRGWLAASMGIVLLSGVLPGVANAAKPSGSEGPPRAAVAGSTTTALDVSAGNVYTCGIRSDGALGCWGYEAYGEATAPDGRFRSVSTGSVHTCAIRVDGTLACWGNGAGGMTAAPDGAFTKLSTGASVACAIRVDGTLACWGNNDHFQATPPPDAVVAVDAGTNHACAIRSDGTLTCWGNNENGRANPPSGTFKDVSAGDANTCAIRADGSLACWGYNGENRSIPPVGAFKAVSVGYAHACAIRLDGTLACWGSNEGTQAAPPSGTFKTVSSGYDHTCGIRSDDTIACWGDDSEGQVTPHPVAEIGGLDAWSAMTDLAVRWNARAALAAVTSYDVNYVRAPWGGVFGSPVAWRTGTTDTTATLPASPGSTYCFSVKARDADGMPSSWSEETCAAAPLDDRSLARAGSWTVGTGAPYYAATFVRSTAAGATLTRSGLVAYWVALLATTCPTCGTVQVFLGTSTKPLRTVSLYSPTTIDRKFIPLLDGDDLGGAPYRGTLTIKVSSTGKPVTIDGLLATPVDLAPAWADASEPPTPATSTSTHSVRAISAGYDHTCAVKADKTLTCWGSNAYGKAMPPSGTFEAVSASVNHTCAVRTDNTLACWGLDSWYGAATPPHGTFAAVRTGEASSCALQTDGSIACWGYDYGEDGEFAPPAGPFLALGHARLDYGDDFCAVRDDGTVDCWGPDYEYGEAATPVGTFTDVDGACAIRTDGTVACSGRDDVGQAEPPSGSFQQVTTGPLHACGIRSDGTVVCWGDNEYLEASPPTGTFTSVDAGGHHTCAVATDGSVACWGHDRLGQVTPRPVAGMKALSTWLVSRSVPLSWRGTALAGLTSFDVRYRRAAWNGGFGSPVTWRAGTAASSGTFTATAGSTYCYAARAHDADGLASSWSSETCTAVPLDDRSLTRAGRWTAGTGSAYYGSTYLRSTTAGATLTRTKVVATRLALVATTCPTCGSVKVYWNGTLIKTVSLTSATTINKKVIAIKTWTSAHTGTLKIKVSSSGRRVIIDGLAIRRS